MKAILVNALLLAIPVLGGCGVELVGGAQRDGEVETVMTDGGSPAAAAAPARFGPGGAGAAGGGEGARFQLATASGTVEAELSAALLAGGGVLVP
jgi:hypothetical protein